MADPISILFVPRPNRLVSIGSIQLDATIREVHEYKNTVTNHPIETGGFVTDHVYSEPIRVMIEGEITDSPVQIFGLLAGITQRRIEAFEQLTEIYRARDTITLVTGLKIYTDMVMVGFTAPRDQRTGQRLQFSAEFQKAEFVSSQIVGIAPEKVATPQQDQAQSEQDIGRQEAVEANEAQAGRASVLSELFR